MFPRPRTRTSSFSSLNPSLLGGVGGIGNLPDFRYGALSVPPPLRSSNSNSNIDSNYSATTTACPPCKETGKLCKSGKRPCGPCVDDGKLEDCLKGLPKEQANMLRKLHGDKKAYKPFGPFSISRAREKPVFDDEPLFPPSSDPKPLRNRFGYAFPVHMEKPLTYPPLGQIDPVLPSATSTSKSTSSSLLSPKYDSVYFVLDFDFRVGRASRDVYGTFGYPPHEVLNQPFVMHLPITERQKWKSLTQSLLGQTKLPSDFLTIPPIELSRLTWEQLRAPVAGVLSVGKQLLIRRKSGESLPVQIVIWFGSCYGATANDVNSFRSAIILAKVTPLHGNSSSSQASASMSAGHPSSLSGLSASTSSGAPSSSRRRHGSFSSLSSGLPALPSLAPLPPPMSLSSNGPLPPLPPLGSMQPLPPLPPLNISPRRRRPSAAAAAPALDAWGQSMGLGPAPGLPPPRSRAPSFGSAGLSRSSSSSDPPRSYQADSYDKLMSLPPVPSSAFAPTKRPSSRNR